MKCQLCGKITSWEHSVGLNEFIVCNKCIDKLSDNQVNKAVEITNIILRMGKIKKEKNNGSN